MLGSASSSVNWKQTECHSVQHQWLNVYFEDFGTQRWVLPLVFLLIKGSNSSLNASPMTLLSSFWSVSLPRPCLVLSLLTRDETRNIKPGRRHLESEVGGWEGLGA